MEVALRQAVEAAVLTELLPRSQIALYVLVLQADGGVLAACINAATAALLDAGIAMRDFVCACTATSVDGTPIVDISQPEADAGGPVLSLAILPRSGGISLTQFDGRTHVDQVQTIIAAAMRGCREIFALMESTVREHTARRIASMSIQQ